MTSVHINGVLYVNVEDSIIKLRELLEREIKGMAAAEDMIRYHVNTRKKAEKDKESRDHSIKYLSNHIAMLENGRDGGCDDGQEEGTDEGSTSSQGEATPL